MTRRRRDVRRYFFWPDTHAPYHDARAVAVALAAVDAFEPDSIQVLGDLYDFYAVSFYTKDPRRKSRLEDEIAEGREAVTERIDALGFPVDFHEGNHEHRLVRYVRERAPALEGFVRSARDALPSDWGYYPYGTSHRLGKVLISHDFGRSGDNAARQGLVDVGANIVFGHTHQLGVSILGQQRGKSHAAMSCGWLGGLEHIDYRHQAIARRRYQHGFGLVHECVETGNVWMTAVPIIGRECVIEGRKVRI